MNRLYFVLIYCHFYSFYSFEGGEHSGITINRRNKGLTLKGELREIETNQRCQGFLCLKRKEIKKIDILIHKRIFTFIFRKAGEK
jgi:hypothetical protein